MVYVVAIAVAVAIAILRKIRRFYSPRYRQGIGGNFFALPALVYNMPQLDLPNSLQVYANHTPPIATIPFISVQSRRQ